MLCENDLKPRLKLRLKLNVTHPDNCNLQFCSLFIFRPHHHICSKRAQPVRQACLTGESISSLPATNRRFTASLKKKKNAPFVSSPYWQRY